MNQDEIQNETLIATPSDEIQNENQDDTQSETLIATPSGETPEAMPTTDEQNLQHLHQEYLNARIAMSKATSNNVLELQAAVDSALVAFHQGQSAYILKSAQ